MGPKDATRAAARAAAASGAEDARWAPRPPTPRHIVLAALLERWLPVGVLVLAVIGAPVLILSPQGLPRLRGLEKELADVEDENATMRREIEELRGKVARLRDDPAAVERIARDDLGLLRQTEVVFQFPTRR
ncbi:MAG: septum formation initiator family protein [Polyangiaceae bacterium]